MAGSDYDAARYRRAGRGKVYESIVDTIGDTPLVALPNLTRSLKPKGRVLAKLEFFNPIASVKDRIGVSMIESLEAQGLLKPGATLIEPTSGNTGIALAFVAASKGYKLILCMPESMSIERRKMLVLLGAQLELTPAERGMAGAVARAKELVEATPGAVMPQQFDTPANPLIHRVSTAEEIWNDTDGAVDAVVSGVGTGGTITGVASVIKGKNAKFRAIAVEPAASPVITQTMSKLPVQPAPHKIQGIGAGFVPKNCDISLIDEVIQVSNEDAFATAQEVSVREGLAVGISSGANIWAALQLAKRPEFKGKRIVTIACSPSERYLSTALAEKVRAEVTALTAS